jgi:hypothetical protein
MDRDMKKSAVHLSTQVCIQHLNSSIIFKPFFVGMIIIMIIGEIIMELDCILEGKQVSVDMVHLGIYKEGQEYCNLLYKIQIIQLKLSLI